MKTGFIIGLCLLLWLVCYRFSCAQDKELYQDPSVHIASFSRGVVIYVAVALVVAGILTMF